MIRKLPQRGFTLVEMMVVVAVLGIMLTIAIPSFTEMMDSSRTRRAADAISSFLVNAKSEAIKQNTTVRVVFQSAGSGATWCAGMTTATTCDCATAGSCTINGVARILDGASYKNIVLNNPDDGDAFSFSPLRGTVNPAGNAQVQSDNGLQVRVVISTPGRIRLCSPSGSGNMGGYAVCS